MGAASNAWLLESELRVTPVHTVFARAERVGKDDLFLPGNTLYGRVFTIEKLSLGYIYDFLHVRGVALGLGGLLSTYRFAQALNSDYGYPAHLVHGVPAGTPVASEAMTSTPTPGEHAHTR